MSWIKRGGVRPRHQISSAARAPNKLSRALQLSNSCALNRDKEARAVHIKARRNVALPTIKSIKIAANGFIGSEGAQRSVADHIALNMECVLGGDMHGEEDLGRACLPSIGHP